MSIQKELEGITVTCPDEIAATVATGLIAGYTMQAFIVAYWIVLTMKSLMDYIDKRNN